MNASSISSGEVQMMSDNIYVGLDFGTTNSAMAYVWSSSKGGIEPRPIIYNDHYTKIPTAIYLDSNGEDRYGYDALEKMSTDPDRVYTAFKRDLILGKENLRPLPDSTPVKTIDLATKFLRYLMDVATPRYLPEPYRGDSLAEQLVVCHPYGDRWPYIMRTLMQPLNIQPALLTEPEAGLYYAHYKKHLFDDRNETILLIDFGGGTCNFLLLSIEHGWLSKNLFHRPRIIDIKGQGQLALGGEDIDDWIVNEFICRWGAQNPELVKHIDSREWQKPIYRWRLQTEAKLAKEKLCRWYNKEGKSQQNAEILVHDLPKNSKLQTTLNFSELQQLIVPDIERQFRQILFDGYPEHNRRLLLGEQVAVSDVTQIILTGGSSNLPWIREKILPEIFPALGSHGLISLLDWSDVSVASGAALYAYDSDSNRPYLPRFLQEDLFIQLADGCKILLAKHSLTLPLNRNSRKAFHSFQFPETGDRLEVRLLFGEKMLELSPGTKEVRFAQSIPKGTLMELKIEINIKGEVSVHISRYPSWRFKEKPKLLIFRRPLQVSG